MLQDNIHSKVAMLMVINIILLIAGTFIDTTSAIVIFAPLFIPICKAMNVDLVHFGMIMTVNLTIGMCTPPLGVCLFVSARSPRSRSGSDAGSTAHAGSAHRRPAFGHLYSRPYALASESL